jgi:hypothetical protein
MGKNIKYGEFTFPASPARPTGRTVSTAKSTKGIPKAMYDAPHAMKDGGMCKSTAGYAKGGPKMTAKREPEAMVQKEVALLKKAGAPKALIRHEMTEMAEPMTMKKGGPAKVEAKLEKHANMSAGKAHGPGAGNKLAKGGMPTFSKTPKFGKTK